MSDPNIRVRYVPGAPPSWDVTVDDWHICFAFTRWGGWLAAKRFLRHRAAGRT